MADQTEKPKLGTRPPLGLKRTVETGKVKQSFSHGRSNTVVVEVKKRRILGRPGEAPPAPAPEPVAEAPKPAPKPVAPAAPRKPSATDEITARREMQTKLLREAEEARLTSLEEARPLARRAPPGARKGKAPPHGDGPRDQAGPRRRRARGDHGAGARQPHGRARRRPRQSLVQDGQPSHSDADDRSGHGRAARHRI